MPATPRSRLSSGLLALSALILAALALPAIASAKDRNHDRIPDRWERAHHLSLKVKQTRRDQDRDGLVNLREFQAGMDPRDDDSDDDGTGDADEGAGKIASYDSASGELIIDVFGGGEVRGLVTADTLIRCDDDDTGDDHGGQSGDDPAGSEQEPGHGGHGGDDRRAVTCSAADLTPGASVHEAELRTVGSEAIWKKVELNG
jgi:hypothetical protein